MRNHTVVLLFASSSRSHNMLIEHNLMHFRQQSNTCTYHSQINYWNDSNILLLFLDITQLVAVIRIRLKTQREYCMLFIYFHFKHLLHIASQSKNNCWLCSKSDRISLYSDIWQFLGRCSDNIRISNSKMLND